MGQEPLTRRDFLKATGVSVAVPVIDRIIPHNPNVNVKRGVQTIEHQGIDGELANELNGILGHALNGQKWAIFMIQMPLKQQ